MPLLECLPCSAIPPRQERIPVRRHSHRAGRCEAVFWRSTNRRSVQLIVLAAQRYELTDREPGRRNGPLGTIAIEVIRLLANLVDFKTGRLEPSLKTLMRYLKRSKDAVVRALKALQHHGFLDWLRRYEPTGNPGSGPQVQQTSNAYRLSLPQRARQLLGAYGAPTPPPEDLNHEDVAKQHAYDVSKSGLSPTEKAIFHFGDTPLGRSIAKLGKAVRQRESAKRTEIQSNFYNRTEKGGGRR